MNQRPNILVIMTDQQSATMMSCTGNPYLSTPAMDRIASQGVRFERAYCTNPVCVPSRFSLATGRMPSEIGLTCNRDQQIIPAIPEHIKTSALGFRLREAGYATAYAGKVHLPKMSAEDAGFEYVCKDQRDLMAQTCAEYLTQIKKEPFCLFASFINPHDICGFGVHDGRRQSEKVKGNREMGEILKALEAAEARPPGVDDAAFFARYCPPLPPNHAPQQDEPQALLGPRNRRPVSQASRTNQQDQPQPLLEQSPDFRREEWTPEHWREHRWAYARLTESSDRQIGRVLESLYASGLADRTLVVFTSDHGDMDASHQLRGKNALYEEATRIPMIVRPPGGLKSGQVNNTHLVSNGLDLLPTLCDWAGVPAPAGLKGRSLRGLVEGGSAGAWRENLAIECTIGNSIVTKRYKYARYSVGASAEQLYDLATDPLEQRNALGDPQNKEALAALRDLFTATFGAEGRRTPAT